MTVGSSPELVRVFISENDRIANHARHWTAGPGTTMPALPLVRVYGVYGDTPVNSFYPPPPSSALRLAPALAWREALAEARFNGGESSARRTTRSRIAHRRRQKIDEVHNALEDWTDDRPPVVARRQMGHHACDDILVKAGGITGTGFELHNFLIRG